MLSSYIGMWTPVYANDLTPWNPTLWARESIAILEESMVFGNLVHRDFNSEVASFGDTVNTRKPAEFSSNMYAQGDTVTYQDATAANVAVKLDQVADVSFKIFDLEETYSFADLVPEYLVPAALALGRTVDRKIAGQASQFLANTTGGLGLLSKTTSQDFLIDTEKKANEQKISDVGRNLVLTSGGKASILQTGLFVSAEQAGTDTALRRALMGNLFGMTTYMSLNLPGTVNGTLDTATTTAAAATAGATTISSTASLSDNQYFTIVGDATPLQVNAVAGVGPYTITLERPLREAVASGVALQPYTQGAVNFAGGYADGWTKAIEFDGSATAHVGQIVSFGAGTDEYVIVDMPTSTSIVLDRALEVVIADNDTVNFGPDGDLNFAFHRNAITFVNRPMKVIPTGSGANMAVASSHNISVRVATSWDQDSKSLKVSMDVLFGIKVLDTALGVVMLG